MRHRALNPQREAELFRLLVLRRTLTDKALRREFGISQSVLNRVSRESKTNMSFHVKQPGAKITLRSEDSCENSRSLP